MIQLAHTQRLGRRPARAERSRIRCWRHAVRFGLAAVWLTLSGCSAENVRECNEVKRALPPLVKQIDAKRPGAGMAAMRAFLQEHALDYSGLAERAEGLPVRSSQLTGPLRDYSRAARQIAAEAQHYLAALDELSPEQVGAVRKRAAAEHEQLASASRSIAAWCAPFGP